MPFQSEKQRRYLWANEPEIARDWADTYGSRIKKNDGGITRLGFKKGGWDGPPGGGETSYGSGNASSTGQRSQRERDDAGVNTPYQKTDTGYKPQSHENWEKTQKQQVRTAKKKAKDRNKIRNITGGGHWTQKAIYGLLKNNPKHALQYLSTVKEEDQELWNNLPQNLKDLIEVDVADGTPYGNWENYPDLKFDDWSSLTQVPGYGNYLKERGMPGVKHSGNLGELGDRYVKYTGELDKYGKKIKATDKYGNTLYGYGRAGGEGQGGGYMGYPSYAAWQAAQGGGDGATVTPVEDTPSAFQESLTSAATTPDYFVGENPLASNLAWGKQMGVDPRTMGRTSWAADGGRIPAAFGGIMDSSTGRRAYGLGSIFKSIGKAAKKVFKSPIGKAALLGGAAFGAHKMGWLGKDSFLAPLFRKKLAGDLGYGGLSLAKLGILGAGALPFFMGGKEEDEDEVFDYMGAKNAYADEIMRIKRGVNAGSLDPNKFSYLPSDYTYTGAEGGRAGYYAGGQSIPSPYTMEDARKTSMQDKMGGITDVMKRADLARQGDVGQMYMAQGGRIGYATGGGRPEEGIGSLDFVDKIVSPEAKALAGESKYSGDASDYREPERDTLLNETIYDRDTDTRDWRFQEDPWKLDGKDVGGLHTRETLDAANQMLDIQEDKKIQLEKIALKKGWSKGEFDNRLKSHLAYQGEGRTPREKMKILNQAFNELAHDLGVYSDWEGDQDPQSVDMRLQDPNYKSKYVSGNAQGGRIGYQGGGETGYPPVTMGQVPQAPPQMPTPQAPPSPMPAPQPNQMAGMNPMMGRMNPMMAGMNPMMGGRARAEEGGLMDLGGMEKDYRNDGGFVPLGGEEKADDVPARLSKNEFVFTADAVRGAGGGDIDQGAEIMENIMKNLEQGGQISEETQGLGGAQEMFDVSERLGEVI